MHPAHDDAQQESYVHEASSPARTGATSALRLPLATGWDIAQWYFCWYLAPWVPVFVIWWSAHGLTRVSAAGIVLVLFGASLSFWDPFDWPSDLYVTLNGVRVVGGSDDGIDEEWSNVASIEVVSGKTDTGKYLRYWTKLNLAFCDETEEPLLAFVEDGETSYEEKLNRMLALRDIMQSRGQFCASSAGTESIIRCHACGEIIRHNDQGNVVCGRCHTPVEIPGGAQPEGPLAAMSEAMRMELSRQPCASHRTALIRAAWSLSLFGLMSVPLLADRVGHDRIGEYVLGGVNWAWFIAIWCFVGRSMPTGKFIQLLTSKLAEAMTGSTTPSDLSALIKMHREELSRQARVWGAASAGFFAVSLGLLVYLLR